MQDNIVYNNKQYSIINKTGIIMNKKSYFTFIDMLFPIFSSLESFY